MAQRRTRLISISTAAVVATGLVGATAWQAASADRDDRQEVRGTLHALNHSGVSGTVRVEERDGHLEVKLDARGVEEMQVHLAHIHGHADLSQASCPDMSMAGSDGILSIGEGAPAYGPVFVTLTTDQTPEDRVDLDKSFATTDPAAPLPSVPVEDMGDLDKFVVVVHGMTAADDGEAGNGVTPGYITALPVACAELSAR